MSQLGNAVESQPAPLGALAALTSVPAGSSQPALLDQGQINSLGSTATAENRQPAAEWKSESTDVWHSGSTSTIFQIVSERIARDSERVEKMPWASRMNRAMH